MRGNKWEKNVPELSRTCVVQTSPNEFPVMNRSQLKTSHDSNIALETVNFFVAIVT